jgi:hypothetical protein
VYKILAENVHENKINRQELSRKNKVLLRDRNKLSIDADGILRRKRKGEHERHN